MEVWSRHRDAGCKRERPAVNVMDPVRLDEVRKTAGTSNSSNRGHFLVPDASSFDQLKIECQDGEITAAWTPGWMVCRNVLFLKRLTIFVR